METFTAETQDCPGNYVAARPSALRCAKCNRPLDVKDAQRTPTGYVCPYYVKARVATFYNAGAHHYIVTALIATVAGALAGFVLQLVGNIGFFAIILTLFVAPLAGGLIAELIQRTLRMMGRARGQHVWLVAASGTVLGAAAFVIAPVILLLLVGSPGAIFALIPVLGLVLTVSTLIARLRI